ncbi:MAG: HAD family hydrolase [Candidatus Heimdallarchaeota archaeon]|nr:HAD family hydrolase [Candidatus Heimdallarchaeota archaeon]
MIKCVSFDFDRTLSYVSPLTHFLIPELLKQKGFPISVEDFINNSILLRSNLPLHLKNKFDIFGTLSKEERALFIKEYNIARIDMLKLDSDPQEIVTLKDWLVEQLLTQQKKILYDDVIPTIKKLYQQNYKLYILSGNHSDGIIELLEEAKILQLFECIITVDKYHPKKTNNFQILLENTGLLPEEILHIGDDLNTDGLAAWKYDIQVIIIRRPHQIVFNEDNLLNFKVINQLNEIFPYLE